MNLVEPTITHLPIVSNIQAGPALTRYEAACRAVADAKTLDEAKDIRNKAVAMAAYARQAKNRDLEADAVEIRMRATRRLDQLRQAQKDSVGLSTGVTLAGKASAGLPITHRDDRPTLASQGIDKNLAHQARALGALSDDAFEGTIAEARIAVQHVVKRVVRGTKGTGDNEWFTPKQYVELARSVLGTIDLDPASCQDAQQIVEANRFYSIEEDGLAQCWSGKIWLNPPYSQPAITHFVDKLVSEYEHGFVTDAILLTHNYSDTTWFQHAAAAASAICLPRGRIKFLSPGGEQASPTQGQAFLYFGDRPDMFDDVFGELGLIAHPSRRRKPLHTEVR